MYVGETSRLFKVRKKEHKSKVTLTNEHMRNGRTVVAKERMGKEDGGLARHTGGCQKKEPLPTKTNVNQIYACNVVYFVKKRVQDN